MKTSVVSCILISILLVPNLAYACVSEPPVPPPQVWIENHGGGMFWVGIEVSLFPPTSPTNCACGLAFSNPGTTSVMGAMVGITNTLTHQTTFLPEFNFSLNSMTTSGLQQQFGASGTWTGLHGLTQPFTPPPLGSNEVFKLWFEVLAPAGLSTSVTFAGGTSNSNGEINEPDDPNHPVATFTATDPNITFAIPEPSSTMLFGVVLLMASFARRRKE